MDITTANTQFARDISTVLQDTNGKWEGAAKQISSAMNTAEEALEIAFSSSEPSNAKLESVNKLFERYGMQGIEKDANGKFNVELVQFKAQELYRKVQRSWQMLLEIVQDAHRMTMDQIRKIGG